MYEEPEFTSLIRYDETFFLKLGLKPGLDAHGLETSERATALNCFNN